jgi:hypothetical protein
VNYVAQDLKEVSAGRPDLTEAENDLQAALTKAYDFAIEQKFDSWAAWFAKAQAADPDMPYHPDMLPEGWPHAAQRCASRAAQAWVFGGMGSWNDIYIPDPEVDARLREVSRELYRSVLVALVAATNCTL